MVGRGFDAELAVTAAQVLDEPVTFDDHRRGAVGFKPRIGPSLCFQTAVIALDTVVHILDRDVQCRRNNSSITFANAAARSVTTSSGSPCAAIAVANNPRAAAMSRRIDQQRCEPLHPAMQRDVIHLDAAFGEEFLHVLKRQPEPQIPAHHQQDGLRQEPEPGER